MNGSGTPPPTDDDAHASGLTRSEELHRYVRGWRERLARGRSGDDRYATQEHVAYRIDGSVSYYRKLERGEEGNYSPDYLDRVAIALHLAPDERTVLYQLATGRPPAPTVRPTNTAVTPVLEQIINALPWPAYISDPAWDVVTFNAEMARWFPSMQYVTNVMDYVFCYADALAQLINWESSWATPMIAQMKAANSLHPNPRLTALIDKILQQNAVARRLWEQPTVYVHPDGDRRQLHVPFTDQPRTIEIVAFTPMRADDLRGIILYPIDQ